MYSPEYEPRLFDAGGDLCKRWYIDYRIWDTDKQAFVRKQYSGMIKYTNAWDRRRVSKQRLVRSGNCSMKATRRVKRPPST